MKPWQRIIDEFQDRLEDWGARYDLEVSWPTWWAGSRLKSSRNILIVQGATDILLYVKVRSVKPGFWGVTANRLRLLRESPCAWFVVLLAGSAETGYFIPAREVEHYVQSGRWQLAHDGDLKIHSTAVLDQFQFESMTQLLDKLTSCCGLLASER